MNRLITAVILVILSFATAAMAEPMLVEVKPTGAAQFTLAQNEEINIENKITYIEVKTRNNTLRIYPCGKVEKLTWDTINRNEDPQGLRIGTWGSGTTLQGTITNTLSY